MSNEKENYPGLTRENPIVLPSAVDHKVLEAGQRPQRLAGLVHDLRTNMPLQIQAPGLWARTNFTLEFFPGEDHELIKTKNGERTALKKQGLDRLLAAHGAQEILNTQVLRILKTVGPIKGIEGTYNEIAQQLREMGGTLRSFMEDKMIESLEPKGYACIVGYRWWDIEGSPHHQSFRANKAAVGQQDENDIIMTTETKARNRAARVISGLGYLHKFYADKRIFIEGGRWLQISLSAPDVASYLNSSDIEMIENLRDYIEAEEDMALWGATIDQKKIEDLSKKKEKILNGNGQKEGASPPPEKLTVWDELKAAAQKKGIPEENLLELIRADFPKVKRLEDFPEEATRDLIRGIEQGFHDSWIKKEEAQMELVS